MPKTSGSGTETKAASLNERLFALRNRELARRILPSGKLFLGFDGMGAVGKGSLTGELALFLNGKTFSTGEYFRLLSWIFLILQDSVHDFSPEDLLPIIPDLHFEKKKDHYLIRSKYSLYNNRTVPILQLREPRINKTLAEFAEDQAFIALVEPKLRQDCLELPTTAIIEGRDRYTLANDVDMLVYLYATTETLIMRELGRVQQRRQKANEPPLTELEKHEVILSLLVRNKRDFQRLRGTLLTPETARNDPRYHFVLNTNNLGISQEVFIILSYLLASLDETVQGQVALTFALNLFKNSIDNCRPSKKIHLPQLAQVAGLAH